MVAGLARVDPGGPQDAPPDPRKWPDSALFGGEMGAKRGLFGRQVGNVERP